MSAPADKTDPGDWDGVDKRWEQLGLPPLPADQKRREMAEAKRKILKTPSKRLGSPRAGSQPSALNLAALGDLTAGVPSAQAVLLAYSMGFGVGAARRRHQRRELRRLNKVIQQMSWKLHVKRRRAWAEAFHPESPIAIGAGVTTAVLLLIVAVLVFS